MKRTFMFIGPVLQGAAAVLVVVFGLTWLTACADTDDPAAPPNGYCASDDACAGTDYCLVEWQDNPVNRCLPREGANALCESDRWCEDGLRCVSAEPNTGGACTAP